jgi:hypothetical protein
MVKTMLSLDQHFIGERGNLIFTCPRCTVHVNEQYNGYWKSESPNGKVFSYVRGEVQVDVES